MKPAVGSPDAVAVVQITGQATSEPTQTEGILNDQMIGVVDALKEIRIDDERRWEGQKDSFSVGTRI